MLPYPQLGVADDAAEQPCKELLELVHDEAVLHPEAEADMELVDRDAPTVHVHPDVAADRMVGEVEDAFARVLVCPVLQYLQTLLQSPHRIISTDGAEVLDDLQCHPFAVGGHPTQREGTGCGGGIRDNG